MQNRAHRRAARAVLGLTVLSSLAVGACTSRTTDGVAEKVELPDDCSAYVARLESCLRTSGLRDEGILAARKEQARLALLSEATRDQSALPQLRTKCIDARERLSAACR